MAGPDFRALCAELLAELEAYRDDSDSSDGEVLECTDRMIERAGAALAQPATEPPTDAEIMEWVHYSEEIPLPELLSASMGESPVWVYPLSKDELICLVRTVLARWGQRNG